ncbi:MAG TPA: hypothetical protein VFC53_02345 [Dehalococcoidia bacterium]|jgi:hypothetical protein|nr:hypothetical protein [Dehalococcoidia bacterium]
MRDWLRTLRQNLDALVAFTLCFVAVAMYFGPGYYFLAWWTIGTLYLVRVALRR